MSGISYKENAVRAPHFSYMGESTFGGGRVHNCGFAEQNEFP